MNWDEASFTTYYTAHSELSPPVAESEPPKQDKTEIYLQIKQLLRQVSTVKHEILTLKENVCEIDGSHRYMRGKKLTPAAPLQLSSGSRTMNLTVLANICHKIIRVGSLDGLNRAELQFLQESSYFAMLRQLTTDTAFTQPTSDFEMCAERIKHLQSVLNIAKENLRSFQAQLQAK